MLADSLRVQSDGTIAVDLTLRHAALLAAAAEYGCDATLHAVAWEIEKRSLNRWMKSMGERTHHDIEIQVPPWDGYWYRSCYIGSLPLLER